MRGPSTEHAVRIAIPLAAAAAIACWASAWSSATRVARADFAFGNGPEPSSLDPAAVSGLPEGRVLRCLYEGLCAREPETLAIVPATAESWEVSEDGLRYAFRIREEARWSDGSPVSARDFEASFERFLNPRTAAVYAYQLWCVKGARAYTSEVDAAGAPRHPFASVGIRALDERSLEIELESATPHFLELCASAALFPVNVKHLGGVQARYPDTWRLLWSKPEHLVTNGPFALVERRINDRIRMAKNPYYWDADRVAMRTIDCVATEHPGTALNLYLTGELDWIESVPSAAVPRLLEREDFRPAPYLGTYFYRVNVTRPFLADPRVRRALALAIDRRAITEKVMRAGELPAWSLVPPLIAEYPGATLARAARREPAEASADEHVMTELALYAADVAEARALLVEAGLAPGARALPPIEIHYNTQANHKDVAEVVADGWGRELGLEVQLVNQEWKVYLDTQRRGRYDVSRSSWIADYRDPSSFLEAFTSGSDNNRTGWKNARYDELVRAASRSSGGERMRALADAERILMDELPLIPIFSYVSKNLVAPRLGGFHANALDEHGPKSWYWMDDAELAAKRAELS